MDGPPHDIEWDAGELGCGELLLELKLRMRELRPRGVMLVHSRDPASPLEMPAWCGLTGHRLARASHPRYWIERKEN